MTFFHFKLKNKFIIVFIGITIPVLFLTNYVWFNSTKQQILNSASARLVTTANDGVYITDTFLEIELTGLRLRSQTDALLSGDDHRMQNELQNFLVQDQNIQVLTVISRDGDELIKIGKNRTFSKSELTNLKNAPYISKIINREIDYYVSEVSYDDDNEPAITLAVPIILLSESEPLLKRPFPLDNKLIPGEVVRILKSTVRLSPLWQRLENLVIDKNGYLFMVDSEGHIMFHPQKTLALDHISARHLKEVGIFLEHSQIPLLHAHTNDQELAHITVNEQNKAALTSHSITKHTGWGVISVMPLSDLLSANLQAALLATLLFFAALLLVILINTQITRKIINPIEILEQGSLKLGLGDLTHRINIKTHDELETLGESFNRMASQLNTSFQSISAERNKLSVILSGITDAVIAVDMSRSIILFNKAAEALTGYTTAEVTNRPIEEILTFESSDHRLESKDYCPLDTTILEGIIYQKNNVKLSTSRTNVMVNLIAAKIKEGRLVNLGCILTIHDITKESQLEEMKLDFVSIAAHELRTPITSIRGYIAEYLHQYSLGLSNDQSLILKRIQTSSEQLNALVENILNVSRIEQGTFGLNIVPIDWHTQVQQIVENFRFNAHEKQITLQYTPPKSPLPLILGDKFGLVEVLSNLLSNAITFTPPNGSVTVWIEVKGTDVVTHVQDTGTGIPKDAQQHLFTKFFRVTGKLIQGSKGTGLGLYIAKSITEMHKGRIWFTSEPGRTTIFSFSIPSIMSKIPYRDSNER